MILVLAEVVKNTKNVVVRNNSADEASLISGAFLNDYEGEKE